MTAFNSPYDDGRVTTVLLHLQHAFEMLLKAALVQGGRSVFDDKTGRSISFEQALRQCQQLPGLKLADEVAGTLRAVDAMRDEEQHWHTEVDEGLLYLHARASVTEEEGTGDSALRSSSTWLLEEFRDRAVRT